MSAYYPQFDICRIDADGSRVTLAAETINVYNVTAASSLGTLVSDSDGVIAEDSFSASAGDVVEFSHSTYPLTIRTTLKATQEQAYTDADTHMTAFVVENLAAAAVADAADIYAIDLDNPAAVPFKIASGKAGESVEVSYQPNKNQRLRLFPVSITADTKSFSRASLDPGNYQDVDVQATDLFTLFTFAFPGTADGGFVDYIANDAAGHYYNYLLPAGTLGDGETVILEYQWSHPVGLGEQKSHGPYFGSTSIGAFSTTSDGSGTTRSVLQRQGTKLVYTTVYLFDAGTDDIANSAFEITGLDFDNDDYEIKYVLNLEGSGVAVITSGIGYKIPAPAENLVEYLMDDDTGEFLASDDGPTLIAEAAVPEELTFLTFEGDILTFEGDELYI